MAPEDTEAADEENLSDEENPGQTPVTPDTGG